MSELGGLQASLGYRFKDLAWLVEALTHPSFGHEHGARDNERLEFLGDAVLQMCATLLLMDGFPEADEGELSRLRAKLVNTRALAGIGDEIALGLHLRVGRGEEANGGREHARNLANATEAVLGAVYRDGGFRAAQDLVDRWMRPRLAALGRPESSRHRWKDPRSRLQELTQASGSGTPTYETVAADGPSHDPRFEVAVRLAGEELGRGAGGSKKSAARAAAEAALARLEGPVA